MASKRSYPLKRNVEFRVEIAGEWLEAAIAAARQHQVPGIIDTVRRAQIPEDQIASAVIALGIALMQAGCDMAAPMGAIDE
jgi:hypothetical protein